ncbi:MAG TPA: dienelactone hydrolase family protein [Kiritimatiellia bacterium]|nr:dienelactone hydrolase family protein [Kiritimatiellia bacterium]
MRPFILFIAIASFIAPADAEIITEQVIYEVDGVACEGYAIYSNSMDVPAPGVLIFHQWSGVSDYEKTRARMLAEVGYAVFIGDIYSQEVRPVEVADKRATAGIYYSDRQLARRRAQGALEAMQSLPQFDPDRIVAIGYCFGGMIVLELARDGAPLVGFVSIHGSLNNPNPEDTKNIRGVVLVQHGADDPFVPAVDLAALRAEMTEAQIDFTVTEYAGAVHSFTDWNAGDDPTRGAAYNKEADAYSWTELLEFLRQHIGN